jgi:pimeloyl-ACP methyl ester carboxylesterase
VRFFGLFGYSGPVVSSAGMTERDPVHGRIGLRVAAIVVGALLAACAGGGSRSTTGGSTSPSPSPTPSPSPEPGPSADELALEASRAVRFPSADGTVLEGRLFGTGHTGIVLAHMNGGNQREWFPLAPALAEAGYAILTFGFQGSCPGTPYGCSEGEQNSATTDEDVRGAADFLAGQGIRRVVLGGASLGAMASIQVAADGLIDRIAPSGVVSLSGLEFAAGYDLGRPILQRVRVPALFVAGEFDGEAAGSARHWHRWAGGPAELRILDTGLHGTEMLAAPDDEEDVPATVERLILDFLTGLGGGGP